jgi:hypothetical protein
LPNQSLGLKEMNTTTVNDHACEHGHDEMEPTLLAHYEQYGKLRDEQAAQELQAKHQDRLARSADDIRDTVILDRVSKTFGRNRVISYMGRGFYRIQRTDCGHVFKEPIGSEHHHRKECPVCLQCRNYFRKVIEGAGVIR